MTEKLQEYLVRYKSLKILSSKEGTSITKDDIDKLRNEIISTLDDELKFTKMYEILKSVEREGFGFYIKLFKCEQIARRKLEKNIYQKVELGVKYMGGSKFDLFIDNGCNYTTKYDLVINSPKKISPEEIVSISNIEILESIKRIDEKVYEYIVERIIATLNDEINVEFEEKTLMDIMSRVIRNNNLNLENVFFIKKEKNAFVLHFSKFENGVSKDYKKVYYNLCEAYDELLKILSNNMENNIQNAFYLELINI